MNRKASTLFATLALSLALMLFGCTDSKSHARGVYMLIDTSGTYTEEMEKAQKIVNYLLGTLQPGDSLAVARIDSGSFSEKDIIFKSTFDQRPSVSNKQKLAFREKFNEFVKNAKGSPYTDITGGILQAAEFLNEAAPGIKDIVIFSDLEEDLPQGVIRDIPFKLYGFDVIALNVTKLRKDNVNPKLYMDRLSYWEKRVTDGGGRFKVINDLDNIEQKL